MQIKLPVVWTMAGYIEVEADDIPSAIALFEKNKNAGQLPTASSYVSDSFQLATDDPDIIQAYQEEGLQP